jgi:GT2 family glycosyltransferase
LAYTRSIGLGTPVDAPVDATGVERQQNYLIGAAMLVSPRFLDVVGPMREDYFLFCEEVEWCLRGIGKGMRLGFAPGSRVKHKQGTTTGSGGPIRTRSRLSIYLNERNRLLLARDLLGGRWPVAAAAALAQLIIRYGRARAWRQMGQGLAGWRAGARDERGPPPNLLSPTVAR